jgi:hypothetical protein
LARGLGGEIPVPPGCALLTDGRHLSRVALFDDGGVIYGDDARA